MKKMNVFDLMIAPNVCDQMLREVVRTEQMSIAHVTMNPGDSSQRHFHNKMKEVYMITRGYGALSLEGDTFIVMSGVCTKIEQGNVHGLQNSAMTSFEHLVLASPTFDPADVEMESVIDWRSGRLIQSRLPPIVDCFDGAKIISYEYPGLGVSLAMGWVMNDPERRKKPHYHKKTTEWIYVVEGRGEIVVNGVEHIVRHGSWITVEPGERHALRCFAREYMVVVCICTPQFQERSE